MPSTRAPEKIVADAEKALANTFAQIDAVALANQKRVLDAFRQERVTPEYFAGKTGYGIDDCGREAIDNVFARIMQVQAAAVRMQFVSGTHALACALFGNLSPGDELLVLTGRPYDTMEKVIGLAGDQPGSLAKSGVKYKQIDLTGAVSRADSLAALLKGCQTARVVYIQKSCGYSMARPTLLNAQIAALAEAVKELNPGCLIIVDNCYGEFVEATEPTAADLIAGSLIKNPGGGLAVCGGYLAGNREAVDAALNRLTAPGIGGHLGLSFGQNRLLLQGLFMAPSVVASAVKSAHLFSHVFASFGFEVRPEPGEHRGDIIQVIKFDEPERLTNFVRALQHFSPIDAHVTPVPADMPGYQDKVIMAGGTFVEGSTIELSADGPLRPPYAAFVQGGLTYEHIKLALTGVLELGRSEEYRFLPG